MPHTPASMAIIVKKDGEGDTTAMMQPQTEKYLGNLLTPDRISNLKQSLNDVFGGRGKATGAYTFAGQAVLHASSGNMQKSVTLFFYMSGVNAKIFLRQGSDVKIRRQENPTQKTNVCAFSRSSAGICASCAWPTWSRRSVMGARSSAACTPPPSKSSTRPRPV